MTLTDGSLMQPTSSFEVELTPQFRELAPMRGTVSKWLGTHSVAMSAVDDLLLILSELCTNAIQATAQGGHPIIVRLHLTDATLTAEVENVGLPFRSEGLTAYTADDERGRGLDIVRALSADVTMHHQDGRSIVGAVMPLG